MIYWGQIKCQGMKRDGEKCGNGAYYLCDEKYLCGVHSRGKDREELEKNDSWKEKSIEDDMKECERIAKENKEKGIKGNVIVCKMDFRKNPDVPKGYVKVFPNRDHGGRKDGLGMPSLSPFNLGPVKHCYPEVVINGEKVKIPNASCLESFHQFSKCYKDEVDKDENPTEEFFECMVENFQKEGQRHKRKGEKPLFSIFFNSKGKMKKFDYKLGRKLYCRLYVILSEQKKDLKKLKKMINDGYNIAICGFDGYSIEDLEKDFKDLSKPFGHERVLYTLLKHDGNYPWD